MFDKLKETLCRELEELERKPEMGAGDLELAYKLTDTIKNIEKICLMAEEGYSGWDGEDYGGGSSGANRGKHYVRGHYSRDGQGGSYNGGSYGDSDGYSGRRGGSRGGYSREDGKREMMEHIQMAIDAAPQQYKEDFRRFMRQLENA